MAAIALPPAAEPVPYKRWTREEVARMREAGLLEGQRLELVGGLLVVIGKSWRHTQALLLLLAALREAFGEFQVSHEHPIDVSPDDLPTNEPEPDAVVLNRKATDLQSTPGPRDIVLVAEVAYSTLRFDLTQKAALYARAGIPEYWVLDLDGRRLIVHQEPNEGVYGSVSVRAADEAVRAGGIEIPVTKLLP